MERSAQEMSLCFDHCAGRDLLSVMSAVPVLAKKERAMFNGRRFKQTESLKNRLRTFARLMRERAECMPAGPEKAATLAKAEKADAAANVDGWVNSLELKPLKLMNAARRDS